jgi:pimeloyl-ACP methyl ester carboxylesterase
LEDALVLGFERFIRMHEAELDDLRKTPLWSAMVSLAPTWLPELEAIAALPLGVDRYRGLSAPALLLVGSVTQPHHVTASDALQRALPDARTIVLDGQGHEAHVVVPDAVADAIGAFLAADARV